MKMSIKQHTIEVGDTDLKIAKELTQQIITSLRKNSQKHNLQSQYLLILALLHIETGEILKAIDVDEMQKILNDSLVEKYTSLIEGTAGAEK